MTGSKANDGDDAPDIPGGGVPPIDDPFLANDPAAHERERRRLEREAKRRGRENRQSLASRVSGALDGAASKGRDAIEQTRERAKATETSAEGVDPPPFRRTPASTHSEPAPIPMEATTPPPTEGGRLSADVAMPRRPSRRGLDTGDSEAVQPEPTAPVAPLPAAIDSETGDWVAPAPIEASPAATGVAAASGPGPATGELPAAPPPRVRSRGSGGGSNLWPLRMLALGAVVLLVAGGIFAVSTVRGGDDPAPAPAGPKSLKTTSISIPEGYTMAEMAGVAKKAGLKGSYEDAAKKAAPRFGLEKLGAPKDATLEGFLFPATYEVEKGAPASDLVDKQLTEGFDANFAQVDMTNAKKKNLTVYDVVTIASMIEREVQVPSERPIVAAVIYNRLKQGIPLEIDATVRYAIGNDYSKSLEPSDLEVDSPYNTYKYPGLPAGPISNPGLDSLKAAANPSDDNYLYYVVKPGTCGEHTFTDNYDEFLLASQEYDAAQAAAGGSPTTC